MIKVTSAAMLISFVATTSFAGSLASTVEEPFVTDTTPVITPAPSSSLFGGTGIGIPLAVGGVLAAVAVGALVNKNSSSDDTTGN